VEPEKEVRERGLNSNARTWEEKEKVEGATLTMVKLIRGRSN